ncbi:MAG: hypothetical protein ACJ704_08945, partial [Nitrososphaeraceae archaeon]
CWNIKSGIITYRSNNEKGRTCRLNIFPSTTRQSNDWHSAVKQGYIGNSRDLKNQEITFIIFIVVILTQPFLSDGSLGNNYRLYSEWIDHGNGERYKEIVNWAGGVPVTVRLDGWDSVDFYALNATEIIVPMRVKSLLTIGKSSFLFFITLLVGFSLHYDQATLIFTLFIEQIL